MPLHLPATEIVYLDRNIRTAIGACRAEQSSVLANRQQMTTVKESLGDGYCDISGTDQNFQFMCEFYDSDGCSDPDSRLFQPLSKVIGSISRKVSQSGSLEHCTARCNTIVVDVSNPQEIVAAKQQALSRFASFIITPLAKVYKLPSTSIHLFWDQQGGLIAFNRNGSLFLNLRYYESWHDDEVRGNPDGYSVGQDK